MDEPVKHWMSGDPVAAQPYMPVADCLALMVERGIRHLPVVDLQHAVIGVITVDDLREALPLPARELEEPSAAERERVQSLCVSDLMSYAPDTLTEGAPLAEAAQKMAEQHIGCLPIVDDQGRLTGILTESDVLQALVTTLWSDRLREERAERSALDQLVDSLRRERAALAAGDLGQEAGRRLEAIERGLERHAEGRFGSCRACQKRIPIARLRAFPGATLCVACAPRSEKRLPG